MATRKPKTVSTKQSVSQTKANLTMVKRRTGATAKRRKPTESKITQIPGMPRNWSSAVARPAQGILFRVENLGTASGASTIVKRYNPNSIWMPEVSGSGGQTPGYTDWAAFYGFYRVIGYKYKIVVTNKEAFDVAAYTVQSSNDPGTSTNATVTSNPMTSLTTLGAKGSGKDQHTFIGKFSMAIVAGTQAVYTADSYRSLIGASPADVSWLGIGFQSFGGSMSLGVDYEVQLSQKTIMYDFLLQTPMILVAKCPRNYIAPYEEGLDSQTRVTTEQALLLLKERKRCVESQEQLLKDELSRVVEPPLIC